MAFTSLVLGCLVPTLLKGCLVEDAEDLYGFPMRKTKVRHYTIRCGVLVSVLEESQKTDEVPGEEFFAGVKSLTANGTFEPAEIRFPIVTVDINYNDKSVFDIDLSFGPHTSALWHNYVLPSVREFVS
ncbi:hypothetical protein MAR_009547 [Mya arenaria]|uniref:Uncharacterized protein n=1 Tax=Mya arenaria TaxID=6604 RepID=A0ABY7E3J6_MYAAR|nr:hypothetical protein MAR_009547 [Mya arenaria]